jgi:hypothetical protein
MASYIVLEAPGGPNKNHSDTKFIADRFSWTALFFPWLWLALHRLWLYAALVFFLQLGLGNLAATGDYSALGIFLPVAISLFVALEGRQLVINRWVAKGWSIKAAIPAMNINAAEQVYYSLYPAGETGPKIEVEHFNWVPSGQAAPAQTLDDPSGIFQFDVKGRR